MKRTITIPNRDSAGWLNLIPTVNVTVDWACPVCGEPMGEPVLRGFCEDEEFYSVHCWENPCGHLTTYGQLNPVEALPPFYRKSRLGRGEI